MIMIFTSLAMTIIGLQGLLAAQEIPHKECCQFQKSEKCNNFYSKVCALLRKVRAPFNCL